MKKIRPQTTWTHLAGQPVRLRLLSSVENAGRTAPLFPPMPLVLLHGLGCSSAAWLPSLRQFAERDFAQTILAPDFPGSGRSKLTGKALGIAALADWTVQFLDTYDIPRACFAANSMGCQVALDLARRYPERVGALVLLGPTTGHSQVSFGHYALGLLRDGFGESLHYNLLLLRMYAQMGLVRYLQTARSLMAEDPLAYAAEIHCPVLVLRGGHDRIVTEDMARGLAAALPHGEYQALDSTAHAAEYNTPRLFVAAAGEFLGRIETATAGLGKND